MNDEADILWEIEAEHLDEAEYLFETREALLEVPHYSLDEFGAGPEARMLAHLDGLIVGGPLVAERLLVATVEQPEAESSQVCAATLALLLESERPLCLRALACLDVAEPARAHGIVRALQLVRPAWANDWILDTLATASRSGLAARLEALRGGPLPSSAWFLACLACDDLAIVRAAARLARDTSDPKVHAALAPLAEVADAEVRRVTLETALCRRVPGAWEAATYWAFVAGESPFRRDALVWVALVGDGAARSRLLGRLDEVEGRADLLWALGFAGSPLAVDRCIELLADEELGRLAGEVVCAIAGLSRDDDRYWLAPPVDDPDQALPPLEDDDLDAELVPTPEALLPIPNPETIAVWWRARRDEFDPSLRYLVGRPHHGSGVLTELRQGPMRRREVLALELALRSAGGLAFDSGALYTAQLAQLDTIAEYGRVDSQRGFSS